MISSSTIFFRRSFLSAHYFCVYTIVWWINFILFFNDFKTVSHYITQDGLVYLCRMGRFSNQRSACPCLPSAGIKDQLHDKLILSKACINVLLFDSWTFPVSFCLCLWTLSASVGWPWTLAPLSNPPKQNWKGSHTSQSISLQLTVAFCGWRQCPHITAM